MKKYLLGVDLGTTNVKAMLFSEDGNFRFRKNRLKE